VCGLVNTQSWAGTTGYWGSWEEHSAIIALVPHMNMTLFHFKKTFPSGASHRDGGYKLPKVH